MAPPPPISVIQTNNCFDIVHMMKKCINIATKTNTNLISLQKNYIHSIYYPAEDLKKCGEFNKFQTNNSHIHMEIIEKTNTHLYYTSVYDHVHQKIYLHL